MSYPIQLFIIGTIGGCSFMELKKSVHKSEVAEWQPTAAFSLQVLPNFIMKFEYTKEDRMV